jgi:site-specific DNA-methyltransferase (adenine-specific)
VTSARGATDAGVGLLRHGDAKDLPGQLASGSVDLAYLDPPFAVGAEFGARTATASHRAKGPVAYDDRWPSLAAYLEWLGVRLRVVHSLLAATGTLWLHLDQRAVHEAKVLCDDIFGRDRFLGEVIWVPGNGGKRRSGPGMAHQTLLLYARGKTWVWNHQDPALREPFAATSQSMHFTHTSEDGRRFRERIVGGRTYRYYADVGRALGSVWADCPSMVANTPLRKESTGYPTQKPLKLLDRIVRASTHPGALVLDPFCGSGTTLVASAQAGRRFVGNDVGSLAIETTSSRLRALGIAFETVADA